MTTVLIIEDDPLIQRMYQQAFTFDKYRALVAGEGEEGLALAQKEQPGIILLDIMMPNMNGLETLKRLKSNPETAKTPVIMLTNLDQDKDVQAAMAMGAVKYIVKADSLPKDVVKTVESILSAGSAASVQ